jgi:hypothetical protein
MCHRNGKRHYCAQCATAFTNLILPKRKFAKIRTTVRVHTGTVEIASLQSALQRNPLPKHLSRRVLFCGYISGKSPARLTLSFSGDRKTVLSTSSAAKALQRKCEYHHDDEGKDRD